MVSLPLKKGSDGLLCSSNFLVTATPTGSGLTRVEQAVPRCRDLAPLVPLKGPGSHQEVGRWPARPS